MNDDRQPLPRVDRPATPRVDAATAAKVDAAPDLIWPPLPEDLAACDVVQIVDDDLDPRLLIGGFPMDDADPRLRPKPPGGFSLPVRIGGFPVREAVSQLGWPPQAQPMPPPLPEFAAAVEPPPLPIAFKSAPVLEPAAVAAAPIEVAPIVLVALAAEPIAAEPVAVEPIAAQAIAAEARAAEPLAKEPTVGEPMAAEPVVTQSIVAAADRATTIAAEIGRVFARARLQAVGRLAPIRRSAEVAALVREKAAIGPRGRAALGLLIAASLAIVSWTEFRAQRRMVPDIPASASVRTPPSTAFERRIPAAVITAPQPEPIATAIAPVRPAPKVATIERNAREESMRPALRRAIARPVRWPSRPAVLPSMPTRPLPPVPRPIPAAAATSAATSVATITPRPEPVAPPMPARAAAPAPLAVVDAPVALETAVRLPSEEDNVRATLARWRTAYSQLDARAAKGVYPSLDVRALERAFQNLKSQDLRFDSCALKLRDESAQAECIGRAIYVPRIGSQTPITAPRAWRFELKRFDQGWTIASARSI
jgi:hypothetical protein